MHFFLQGRETRKAVSVRGVEGGTVCVKVSALSRAFQVNALKMTRGRPANVRTCVMHTGVCTLCWPSHVPRLMLTSLRRMVHGLLA